MTAFHFDARAVRASVLAERRSTPATAATPATEQGKITESVAESQVSQTPICSNTTKDRESVASVATVAEFAERAAICEFDGGLDRSAAELLAAACVVPLAPNETIASREAIIVHFAEHLDRSRECGRQMMRRKGDAA